MNYIKMNTFIYIHIYNSCYIWHPLATFMPSKTPAGFSSEVLSAKILKHCSQHSIGTFIDGTNVQYPIYIYYIYIQKNEYIPYILKNVFTCVLFKLPRSLHGARVFESVCLGALLCVVVCAYCLWDVRRVAVAMMNSIKTK